MARTKNLNTTGRAASTEKREFRESIEGTGKTITQYRLNFLSRNWYYYPFWYNDEVYKLWSSGKKLEYEKAIRIRYEKFFALDR